MSNIVSDEKFEIASDLAIEGFSVREISQIVHIARETAHRIQKVNREALKIDGIDLHKRKGGYWEHKKQVKGKEK